MKRVFGRGAGRAAGFPVEAVVADLCDTRDHLNRLLTQTREMKEKQEEVNSLMRDMRDDLRLIAEEMRKIPPLLRDVVNDTEEAIAEGARLRGSMTGVVNSMRNIDDRIREDIDERRRDREQRTAERQGPDRP